MKVVQASAVAPSPMFGEGWGGVRQENLCNGHGTSDFHDCEWPAAMTVGPSAACPTPASVVGHAALSPTYINDHKSTRYDMGSWRVTRMGRTGPSFHAEARRPRSKGKDPRRPSYFSVFSAPPREICGKNLRIAAVEGAALRRRSPQAGDQERPRRRAALLKADQRLPCSLPGTRCRPETDRRVATRQPDLRAGAARRSGISGPPGRACGSIPGNGRTPNPHSASGWCSRPWPGSSPGYA